MTARRSPSRLTPHRVLVAWTGLWALLLQILVPVAMAIPVAPGPDGLPRTLIICSAMQPPRTVPVPGSETPAPDSGRSTTTCAVCMAFATGSTTDLPATVELPTPLAARVDLTPSFATAVHDGQITGLPRARAPPVVA